MFADGRTVALVGVDDLVVVETDDAVFVCPRERAQDVHASDRADGDDCQVGRRGRSRPVGR